MVRVNHRSFRRGGRSKRQAPEELTERLRKRPGGARSVALSIGIMLFLALAMPARGEHLEGKVVDSDGKSIPGVSVVTNVHGVGTVTSETGEYSLQTIAGEVTWVTFSSVGYRSEQYAISDIPDVVTLRARYYRGQDILVTADRGEFGITPIAFDNVSEGEISRDYTVGEFPLLLETTPNLYAYSDAGSSLGYSYMRIRGFDDKRIVTYINGVPLNDPEDHATYFVDLPDFASNVSDIQVQRGVGNSLYGDASFGGSVNIVTSAIGRERQASMTVGYGNYETDGDFFYSDVYKQSIEYSSGLIDGRWNFAGRFSNQKTGGYRYDSWYDGWSYYFSIARLDPRMTSELYVYGGPMRMHLSYWGAPRDEIERDRKYNPLSYDNETDNFNQPHVHFHNIYRFDDRATMSNTLYYIKGEGYYEQFKDGEDLSEYNIPESVVDVDTATGLPYESGDLVRQQWVSKYQYGWNPRVDIEHGRGTHSFGGSVYYFESDHWGQVVWAEHINGSLPPRLRFYQYTGDKWQASLFGQEYYQLTDKLSGQVTAQFRYMRYDFDQQKMGAFSGFDYDLDWLFFSPRIGVNYSVNDNWSLYGNFAVSSRTPSDAAIYDANDPNILPSLEIVRNEGDTLYEFGESLVENERVYDIELGGRYQSRRLAAGVNLFWMEFTDEVLPYGGINPNTGLAVTVNVDRSLHAGIELTGAYRPVEKVTLSGNVAYNHNRIREYSADFEIYDADGDSTFMASRDFTDQTIPLFPEYLGNAIVEYAPTDFRFTYRLRIVGKQYMELMNIEDLGIDAYTVSSLSAEYRLANVLGSSDLVVRARVDNLFDKEYETSGYGGNYGYYDSGVVFDGWAEYFVAAERSIYAEVRLDLF